MSRKRALEGSVSTLAQQEIVAAAIVQRGITGITMGDSASAEALARLNKAAGELKNQKTARLLSRAIAAIHAQDYGKADALALEVLEKDERHGVAWHVLAIAREKTGDFMSSMRAYEAALQLLTDHGPVAGDLGRLAFRMNMPEIAAKFFAHYRLARPDCVEAVNNLACALRDLNQCVDAIEILKPAIMQDQEQPLLWNTLGTVMCSLGDGQQALTFFDEALRLAPTLANGYHNRAYARLDLGDAAGALETDTVLQVECNLDDMNPEWYEPLMAGLLAAGALDVALAPIQMKKHRPAVALTVIAPLAAKEGLLARLFADSTTLGVRCLEVERVTARRWFETIETPYGPLTVKVMEYGGRRRLLPEYEACRRMAEAQGLPLIEVYRLVPRE